MNLLILFKPAYWRHSPADLRRAVFWARRHCHRNGRFVQGFYGIGQKKQENQRGLRWDRGSLCFLGDLMGEPVADKDLALGHLLNSPDQLLHCTAFENVTASARFQSSHNVVVIAVDGQDDGA